MIEKLRKEAAKHGLTVKECSEWHYQILGGVLLVNYYPLSKKKTAYLAGTSRGFDNTTIEEAVQLALKPKPLSVKVKRRGKYGRVKQRLYRKSNLCFRCGLPIATVQDATVDHIVPLSKGGLDHQNNMALSHNKCNRAAADRMPNETDRTPKSKKAVADSQSLHAEAGTGEKDLPVLGALQSALIGKGLG